MSYVIYWKSINLFTKFVVHCSCLQSLSFLATCKLSQKGEQKQKQNDFCFLRAKISLMLQLHAFFIFAVFGSFLFLLFFFPIALISPISLLSLLHVIYSEPLSRSFFLAIFLLLTQIFLSQSIYTNWSKVRIHI